MIFKFRAGALASTAVMFAALFGAGMTGAQAQVQTTGVIDPAAVAQEPQGPRFVAGEVVQPLPGGGALEQRVAQAPSLQQLVGDMPIETDISADMKCLAEAVYFESRGEPLAGQLAVARVVINRSQSGRYPADYCSVVTQPAQFSFVRGGRIPQADESSEAWRRARAIAQIAHQALWPSEAGDAQYFHATYVHPGWARHKTQLAQIDTHIFYR